MKIIFLDIDGVLNSVEYTISTQFSKETVRTEKVDPVKVGLLRFVCEQTGANIVVSSTWRHGRDASWFRGFFSSFGWFNPPIIDVTPTQCEASATRRGDEIAEWLKDFHHSSRWLECVIVDDDNDFHPTQQDMLVQTNNVHGLSLNNAIEMIDILGPSDDANFDEIDDLRRYCGD